jgi:hypothetical protein
MNWSVCNKGTGAAAAINKSFAKKIHHGLSRCHTTYFEASGDFNFGWNQISWLSIAHKFSQPRLNLSVTRTLISHRSATTFSQVVYTFHLTSRRINVGRFSIAHVGSLDRIRSRTLGAPNA